MFAFAARCISSVVDGDGRVADEIGVEGTEKLRGLTGDPNLAANEPLYGANAAGLNELREFDAVNPFEACEA